MTREFPNELTTHKYVCIFPDYSASGLWDKNNIHVSNVEDLPVSKSIQEEIELMAIAYNYEGYNNGDKERYNYALWSYEIALKVKKELPDWTIQILNVDNELGLDNLRNHRSNIRLK